MKELSLLCYNQISLKGRMYYLIRSALIISIKIYFIIFIFKNNKYFFFLYRFYIKKIKRDKKQSHPKAKEN